MRRLDEHGLPYRHEHLAYAEAGHGLFLCNTPATTINNGTLL